MEKSPGLGSHAELLAFDSVKSRKRWKGDWGHFFGPQRQKFC